MDTNVQPDLTGEAEAMSEEDREGLIAAQRAALEQMLHARLKASIDARRASGIEEVWEQDQDQYDGFDELNPPGAGAVQTDSKNRALSRDTGAPRRVNGGRSKVFLNITKGKTDTAVSRVSEMVLPTDDRPWEYEPTPVPDLDKAVEEEDQRPIPLADGTTRPAHAVAATLLHKAREKAKRMQDHVDDWLVEGSVYAEMRKVVRQAGRLGTGVIKGPVPCMRKDRRWRMADGVAVVEIASRLAPTSKAISCWNLFPDPAVSEDLHAGAWVWERDELTKRAVRELADQPDYDRAALLECLREGPLKPAQYHDRFDKARAGQTSHLDTSTYEVWYYWGDIDAETLIAGDFVVPGVLDDADPSDPEQAQRRAEQIADAVEMATVSVMVTMINGRVVRVAPNPLESGAFPYDVFPWEPVDGQLWGRGIPRKMAAAQRMLNASARAMLENAGMAGGPQIVAMRDLITPADDSSELNGRKLWWFDANDDIKDVRAAFAVFNIEPVQQAFQAIIEFALTMADQLSNLPLLMQGAQGQAPDTVGGLAMLQANATSPLKAIAKQADDCLFVPHLTRYYEWGMQDPKVPEDAKGDLRVKARAASALAYRDFLAGFLPQLLPFVKDPAFRLDPEKYISELLRANRFSPEQVKLTGGQIKALEEQAANTPPDPKILAIQQKAEQHAAEMADRQQAREIELRESEMERQHQMVIAEMEREIQVLEFAGQREITFDQLKAMLAKTAMELRHKGQMFQAEQRFAETTGEGRGL